ncbi:phosphoribosylaminoimidazolesuccinocarboxamide synthase, partial [Jatrophihabitans endophyticus]|uniref:phosphoribosylaminoimidazolesuccinocarboxamide synthase n=1 Tax=Jatrophihabitans endophyticus TaxID=1206085 RepID=UPI0019E506E2|nr:phosphoribosylaminoimidazolesuccinocarboxamide synthase [Jatrophihabitans endophyticus]
LVHVHSGKVRDLYRAADAEGDDRLIMVASDRISAFDFVLDTPIPDKGRILTALSIWWFEQLADVVPNHLGPDPMAALDHPLLPDAWRGRAVVCRPLSMIPVEAVARGYLTGSGLLDYRATGAVCGIDLPPGLVDGDRLPEPIFTPADKAEFGSHDENISYAAVERSVGADTAAALRDLTLRIYGVAAEVALARGIVLADTKFEFGTSGDDPALVLGDEVLTPDSSRFWPADDWQPGRAQPSFDKQFVRNWLLSAESGWDRAGDAPPPPLPDDVAAATRARYVEAYERLTGLRFADWPGPSTPV